MADKLSITNKVYLIVLLVILCWLFSTIFGCVSTQEKNTILTYPCPSCGYKVDASLINKNIRIGNTCASCGEVFFYTTVVKSNKTGAYQPGYYGRIIYGPSSSYQLDVSYQRFGVRWYFFKETPTGFSEISGYFQDSKVKSFRVRRR